MVWECLSYYRTSELAVIAGTMRAANNQQTLTNYLLPAIGHWYGDGPCVFQQDNAPCHKAQSITQFLDGYNFNVMDWSLYRVSHKNAKFDSSIKLSNHTVDDEIFHECKVYRLGFYYMSFICFLLRFETDDGCATESCNYLLLLLFILLTDSCY